MGRSEGFPNMAGAPDSPVLDKKRVRKRELDRISQQRKRQKDRETICRLKSQLQSLQEPPESNQLVNLMAKHEEDQAKMQKQKDRIKEIQALLQASLDDLEESDSGARPGGLPVGYGPPTDSNQNQTAQCEIEGRDHANYLTSKATDAERLYYMSELPIMDFDGISWNDPSETAIISSSSTANAPLSSLLTFASNIPELPLELDVNATSDWTAQMVGPLEDCPPAPPEERQCTRYGSVWVTVDTQINGAKTHFQYDGDIRHHINGDADAHMILTGVIEGWDKAARNVRWNCLWECLSQIDRACHKRSGVVERLASLWALLRMFKFNRYVGDPRTAALPLFMHPRPVQLNVPHAAVADYFVWPGVREHFIFNHRKYSNNTFSRDFETEGRFLWPYEVRDTYVRNRETNFYEFSSMFLERADDLRCYTYTSSFLAKYPEFRGDVPVFDPAPHPVLKSPGPNFSWHHFPVTKTPRGFIERRQSDDAEDERRLCLTSDRLRRAL